MTALKMTVDEALALADQWCAGLTMDADSKGWGAILLVLAEEVRRLREREAGLLEQHSRDSAELRRVCAERDEARADERTAMGYLAGVRQVVGGEDFPDMVRRVERLRAELEPAEAEFEVVEDDADAETQCAYITGPREQALREAMHYAAVYSKDGPVKVREVIRRDIPMEATNAG